MIVRELVNADWDDAQRLYGDLTGDTPIGSSADFNAVLAHPGTRIIGAEVEGVVQSMLTLHVLPNVTYGGRPYALIENVVTAAAFRSQGLARKVMEVAIQTAWDADAYKIMLLTGQDAGARGFYEKLGFRADQKYGMALRRVPTRKPNV